MAEGVNSFKTEVAVRMALVIGLPSARDDLTLLHEGPTQSGPLIGERAVSRANVLAHRLLEP